MPASAAYLSKYLTASNHQSQNSDFEDSSRPKKKRKKDKSTADSGLLIADDDEGLLLSQKKRKEDVDEDGPLLYSGSHKSAEFRKKKNSAWKTVQAEGDAEAEKLIEDAVREQAERRVGEEGEEAPAVVETGVQDAGPKMSSGAKAGLQTAADTELLLAAENAREAEEVRKQKKKKQKRHEVLAPEEETIYRDATGRRIDVSLARQQARAAEVAKIQAEKKEREAAMGDVQLRQREQAKQDLDEAKFLTLGRTAEDEELNERQKEELRWDDPMAQYIANQRAEREAEEAAKHPRSKKSREQDEAVVVKLRKREYQGAAPPNRYGIKPGWRWDGVDRGNGFEKEWFQARGKKTRNENLEYQMAYDE